MRTLRGVAGAVGAAAALALLARGSAATVRWRATDASDLRVSWTARPERIERCRALSAEEIAREAAHMRQRVECDGHLATYALEVAIDGNVVAHSVVRGGGLRHDRPLHVLMSVPIAHGKRRVRVSFVRRESVDSVAAVQQDTMHAEPDTGLYAGRAAREAEERKERTLAAIAPRMALDTTLTIAPSSVLLITYDPVARTLKVHRSEQR
jgi:hypothetical protein